MNIRLNRQSRTAMCVTGICAFMMFSLLCPYNAGMSVVYQAAVALFIIFVCRDRAYAVMAWMVLSATRGYIAVSTSPSFSKYYSLNASMLMVCIIGLAVMHVCRRAGKLSVHSSFFLFSAFGLLLLATRMWASYPDEYQKINNFSELCLLYVLVPLLFQEEEDWFIFKLGFVMSGAFLALGIIPHLLSKGSIYIYKVQVDRNYQACILIMCILQTMTFLLEYRRRIHAAATGLCVLIILGDALILLTSASRAGLLALVMAVLVYILVNVRKPGRVLVALLITGIGVIFAWEMGLLDKALERFSSENVSSGNGRIEIWKGYGALYLQGNLWEMLFGRGLVGEHYVTWNAKFWVAHNTFISALVTTGAYGLFALVIPLVKSGASLWMRGKGNELVVMLPVLFMCCTLDMYYRLEFVLYFAAIVGMTHHALGRRDGQ